MLYRILYQLRFVAKSFYSPVSPFVGSGYVEMIMPMSKRWGFMIGYPCQIIVAESIVH